MEAKRWTLTFETERHFSRPQGLVMLSIAGSKTLLQICLSTRTELEIGRTSGPAWSNWAVTSTWVTMVHSKNLTKWQCQKMAARVILAQVLFHQAMTNSSWHPHRDRVPETPLEAPARATHHLSLEEHRTTINDAPGSVLCSAPPTPLSIKFSTLSTFSHSQIKITLPLSPVCFTGANAQNLEAIFFSAVQPPSISTTAGPTHSKFFSLSTSLIHEWFPNT